MDTLERRLERARQAWLVEMHDSRPGPDVVALPTGPQLEERHLANCRVLPRRDLLMRKMRPGGRGAEIGVFKGDFSRTILNACLPSELHLIDIDLTTHAIAKLFQKEVTAGKVVLHEGEAVPVLQGFPDEYFDFIYIDANHSYRSVKGDIAAATPRLKPEGFLIFNDYTYWSPCECMKYGVIQAVNELCLEDDWEMLYFALEPYMYCDVALRRRGVNGALGR